VTDVDASTGVGDEELVETLRTTVAQLEVAESELERQNDELATLQNAIAADARRLQLLFDAAPIAFVTTSRSGVITEANLAAADLLQVPQRFLPGKPLAAFIDVDRRRVFRQQLLSIESTARIVVPMRMRRRGGVAFEARASAVAVGDEVMWTLVDETLLEQAEQQVWTLNRELEQRVRERTEQLETLLEQLPVGVAVVAPDGSVTWLNRRAHEILGQGATSLDHLFPDGARTPDGDHMARRTYPAERARRGETVRDVRLVIERDDAPVTLEVTAVPLGGGGGGGGVVVVFDDVTERARREQADRQFVSNAAHQIRTPITIIASVVAALQGGGRDDPEALDRFLAHIEGAVTRLAGLAEALLTLARIQRGFPGPVEIVPIRPLVEEVVDGRDVTIEIDDRAAAIAVRSLLLEAVANVVDNAFVHGGGRVEVAAGLRHETAVLDVRDHGAGIPAADRQRALERFSTSGRGAGLGLAIACEAAAALGGSLTLDDAAGGGLAVRFELPGARLL
jgi:PAS domain S-box-containing protein